MSLQTKEKAKISYINCLCADNIGGSKLPQTLPKSTELAVMTRPLQCKFDYFRRPERSIQAECQKNVLLYFNNDLRICGIKYRITSSRTYQDITIFTITRETSRLIDTLLTAGAVNITLIDVEASCVVGSQKKTVSGK